MSIEVAKSSLKSAHKTPPPPGVWDSIDTQIVYSGTSISLPATPIPMSHDDAIVVIARLRDAENQKYDVMEWVHGAPWDALTAVAKAMHQIYGVVIAESIQTFFGEIKPELITIVTGPEADDNIQVAMGQMTIPNVTAPVQIGFTGAGAYVKGTVRKKDRSTLVNIATLARQIMSEDSIYKGKAIKLGVDEYGDLDLNHQPKFIQLNTVLETDMIHTKVTFESIDNNIFGPLKYTEACRKHKIPLKRGILLHGKYGTGKSLTARVTAKVAIDNGWTFIMLDKAQGLGAAIEFAKTYQPCVIFAEDIDRAADRDDEQVNHLVNLLDGLLSKDMEMMVVLTTNFVDDIDRALLRPGRFDAVIKIDPPDAETVVRVVRHYARELIEETIDLTEVGDILTGQIPATIREVVERSKVRMLMRDRDHLTAGDLISIAASMKSHIDLLSPPDEEETVAEKFYNAMVEVIQHAIGIDPELHEKLSNEMRAVRNGQGALIKNVAERLQQTNSFAQAAAGSADKAAELAENARNYAKADLATTEKVLKQVS